MIDRHRPEWMPLPPRHAAHRPSPPTSPRGSAVPWSRVAYVLVVLVVWFALACRVAKATDADAVPILQVEQSTAQGLTPSDAEAVPVLELAPIDAQELAPHSDVPDLPDGWHPLAAPLPVWGWTMSPQATPCVVVVGGGYVLVVPPLAPPWGVELPQGHALENLNWD